MEDEKRRNYISDDDFKNQISLLNKHYNPASISFKLLGLNRTVNKDWSSNLQHDTMMTQLHKGNESALNLYYVHTVDEAGDYSGLCHYPDSVGGTTGVSFKLGGCVVEYSNVPRKAIVHNFRGFTTIHEVGHWFGLPHTFEGDSCSGPGDGIADTPAQANATVGCPARRDSCPDQLGDDPIHNFMDHSDEECQTEFTPGQFKVMHDMWTKYRNQHAELQPITPILQKGKLPYYPKPAKSSTFDAQCKPDADGNIKELREEYCGTEYWCWYTLWEHFPSQKQYDHWTLCTADRANPDGV
ncbi:hypothetical protein QQS21_006125 [Conoideocrella luteorostrata]|uniref:Peptidase M43 pregnancy-associated plasma-A domain-containing protein n=1 Tax=Conoideocrella luteorostrata TaxID=1105319 RepID=A0AAJ0CN62_9HYPO|nr:hypothetical protein QQS21_006125 [Conoideocrella luteorostrata]